MAIKLTSVKCPACGAAIDIEEGMKEVFCTYCGTKIIINNENEFIYHHIDEASLKRAETEHMVELKKIEMAEKDREDREKWRQSKIKISAVLGIVAIISFIIGAAGSITFEAVGVIACIAIAFLWLHKKDNAVNDSDTIKVPRSISGYESKTYMMIESAFRSAGFTNIKCVPLDDLTTGFLKKPNMVDSIAVNGHEITSGGRRFSQDAAVLITYHSFPGRNPPR